MGIDQSHENTGREDFADGAGSERAKDPIARNPKDITPLEKAMEKMRIGRDPDVSTSPASPRAAPSRSVDMPRYVPTAAPATDLLASVLRYKWSLLAVFVLIAAPALAAIWTQMIPKYQARAEVRIRPIIPRLVFRTEDNGLIPLYDSFVNTQVSVVRSPTVLQRVLDQQGVRATQWYQNPSSSLVQRLSGPAAPPMERLKDGLSVKPRPRTEIIDVTFLAENAAEARLIVDSVLDQYVAFVGEKSDATEDKLYSQLVDEYQSLQNQIKGGEQTYADLCKAIGTDTPQELVAGKRIRLDEAQARLSDLRNRRAVLEWELQQIMPADSNELLLDPAARLGQTEQPKYHEDAEWRKLDVNVKTIEQQIADSVYGPTHAEGMRLKKELNFARDLLRQRQVQLDEQWQGQLKKLAETLGTDANIPGSDREWLAVDRRLERTRIEEQLLAADLQKQEADFNDLFARAQLLEKENNALRYKRQLFDAVRERLDQKNIERKVPGSIEVAARAYAPSKPQGDRRIAFTIMALALALGAGSGVAFLRASRNQVIYTPKDMPGLLQPLLLGHMPWARATRPRGRFFLNEGKASQSYLVESVRLLRTALAARLGDQSHATVLVTSADEGTGKSSFVVMLGESIAQAGGKVLLVDADFHKRSLSQRFDMLGRPGFMESLSGRDVDGLPVYPTGIPGLDIMPAGRANENGAVFEGTANGAFKVCMGQLFRQCGYDIVLFDTSPILPVADTVILARQVDGAVLVEREHLSRRTDVVAALGRLGATGGHLLGAVLVGSGGHEDREHQYRRYSRAARKHSRGR